LSHFILNLTYDIHFTLFHSTESPFEKSKETHVSADVPVLIKSSEDMHTHMKEWHDSIDSRDDARDGDDEAWWYDDEEDDEGDGEGDDSWWDDNDEDSEDEEGDVMWSRARGGRRRRCKARKEGSGSKSGKSGSKSGKMGKGYRRCKSRKEPWI